VVYLNVNFFILNKNSICIIIRILGARNHASEIIEMAFDMLDSIVTVTNPTNNDKLKIRIG
jgi:hypothetical protein